MSKVRTHSRFLEVVPDAQIDPNMRTLLQNLEQADGQRTTFIRGTVTGDVWCVHHLGNRPPKKFIREAEANEMAALPTAGSA